MFKIKGGISHKGTKTTKQNISRQGAKTQKAGTSHKGTKTTKSEGLEPSDFFGSN